MSKDSLEAYLILCQEHKSLREIADYFAIFVIGYLQDEFIISTEEIVTNPKRFLSATKNADLTDSNAKKDGSRFVDALMTELSKEDSEK